MTPENLTFICMISREDEQEWLTSLLKMCFKSCSIVCHNSFDTLEFDGESPDSIFCCNENELHKVTSALQDSYTYFPILLLSGNKPKKLKDIDQEHFTVEVIPTEMMSPALVKLAITSLLRDYKKTQQLKALAHFDPLTGTANRHLFYDRLKQAVKQSRRNNTPLSIMYFDLDKFKPVNDTYGHHVGDLLLKSFSKKVKACLRDIDTLGRLGGDEFCAIILNASLSQAEETAKRVIEVLDESENLDGQMLSIQTSIGIVTCNCSDNHRSISYEKLMKIVDAVTYRAKKDGKHSYISQEI